MEHKTSCSMIRDDPISRMHFLGGIMGVATYAACVWLGYETGSFSSFLVGGITGLFFGYAFGCAGSRRIAKPKTEPLRFRFHPNMLTFALLVLVLIGRGDISAESHMAIKALLWLVVISYVALLILMRKSL